MREDYPERFKDDSEIDPGTLNSRKNSIEVGKIVRFKPKFGI